MDRGLRAVGTAHLLERAAELDGVFSALDAAAAGEGQALLVEGPPGIGKTALLQVARRLATERGMTVLSARGGELEAHFPYGAVRQLFEPQLRRAGPARRRQLLSGAAELAGPVLAGTEAHPPGTKRPTSARHVLGRADAVARDHGLFWLAVNLCELSPLLVCIDDVHWVDQASLRFVHFLLRRLDGLPAAVVLALRPGERTSGLLAPGELATTPQLRALRPAPLSREAVAELVHVALDECPEPAFAQACLAATGGVPLLVHELTRALGASGVRPIASEVARVGRTGPRGLAQAVLGRLRRVSPDAEKLARAIAVLGQEATLPRAARLVGLDEAAALRAIDILEAEHVLAHGGCLELSHPILRTAVHDDMAPGQRSAMHRRAADLLCSEGAAGDAVAGQLLATEPTGCAEVTALLRHAALQALERGAPEEAVAYLTRALAEGPEREARAALLVDLARAERAGGRPEAAEHLRQARELAGSPTLRAEAALQLAGILVMNGDWEAPATLVREALADLGEREAALSERLERLGAGHAAYDPRSVAEYDRHLPRLRALASRQSVGGRSIALLLAGVAAWRGEAGPGDAARLGRDWEVAELLASGMDEWAIDQGVAALVLSERLEQAREVAGAMVAVAEERGSMLCFLTGAGCRGWVEARRGHLVAAEADIGAALASARELGVGFAVPFLLWALTEVLLERPGTGEATRIAEEFALGAMEPVCNGALLLEVRGRLRCAEGRTAAGEADLRSAGEIYRALGFANPNGSSWRSALALALGTARRAEALGLAREELDDATRVGHSRAIGVALRTLGLLEGGVVGLGYLQDAVKILQTSPAPLEHARALVDLGAAMRRNGERAAARAPLRQGLDGALASGASVLAERAATELAATGARPRRLRATGVDALTPSELRVARLAAQGRTNNEVAQALFVTPKTVDTHLCRVYAKLGISSRHDLNAALEAPPLP